MLFTHFIMANILIAKKNQKYIQINILYGVKLPYKEFQITIMNVVNYFL